jgi:hypothetical protein
MRNRKKDAGRHEPERVPVSVHTAATTAYRLLWQGHVHAAHGIHILPDLISYPGMNYCRQSKTYTVIAPSLSRKKFKVGQFAVHCA